MQTKLAAPATPATDAVARAPVGSTLGRLSRLALLTPVMALAVACDDDEPPEEAPVVPVPPAAAAVDSAPIPITDVLLIVVPERAPLIGRRVALGDMKVQTVTGPRTFWVGPDSERQLFVVLDSSAVTDSAQRAMNVEPGQTVSVTGVVRGLPLDLAAMAEAWSLSEANQATLRREQVYLAADSLRIAPR